MAKKTKNIHFYEAIGRRKRAAARVRLYIVGRDKEVSINSLKIKAGDIYVNHKPIGQSFSSAAEKEGYLLPFKLTGSVDRFAVSILLEGGGKSGQLDAIIHGIARALEQVDKTSYRPILKKNGLLTRDPRKKERRKVGTGGKARREKQSPKR